MFLKQMRTKSGRVRLCVYESYWDGKRARQRSVRSLGFVDELMDEHEDPVAWGRSVAAEMTAEKRAAEQAVAIEIHPAQKVDKKARNERNLGSALVLASYHALGVEKALRNATAGTRASFDVNAALRLLVAERVVDPGSKRAAWLNRDRYFFRTELTDDDIYRALDLIAAAKDAIVSAMNRKVAASSMRDTSSVFYDVTNYYFEVDGEDELRKRGVSKEKRHDPIVQMGLLQDANGIPMAYRLFPGNTTDCLTMLPVLFDMKRDLGLSRVVVVADKGLNTSTNICACQAKGDGFVLSQSVRGTKSDAKLKGWVLDPKGYLGNETFRMKSCQGTKVCHLRAEDTQDGAAKDVEIDVKYVAFWSAKYARRARAEREKLIERAKGLVENPGAYTKATAYGAAKYVRNIHFDKKTGEVVKGRALSLDTDAIEAEEALDGYYLIATSETGWDDERVVDTYRELWQIEESFKVTKSELRARPVFVWTPAHIEAHFLTCYIALTIVRVLQALTGLSASVVCDEVSSMGCVNVDANWWVAYHRTDATDSLADATGLTELKLKNHRTSDVRKLIAKANRFELPHRK